MAVSSLCNGQNLQRMHDCLWLFPKYEAVNLSKNDGIPQKIHKDQGASLRMWFFICRYSTKHSQGSGCNFWECDFSLHKNFFQWANSKNAGLPLSKLRLIQDI